MYYVSQEVAMTTWIRLFLVAILATLTTACAIPMGRGTLYIGGITDAVTVTNNLPYPCDLFRNGDYLNIMTVGGTGRVPFGISSPNMLISCKAFEMLGGRKRYIGITERTFSPGMYTGTQQSWIIDYIQPPRRSF